ncbi:hypothetical protein [Kingella sp. (in: b-proteobacteria)]|uniref:hypothetical protein n=1 Tax=Kingella sp. (in: b-proteobacteria) TaxID=2020713 RepID=UPI0026DD3295|nr:hypothetical protein [Kingella sp. (in: b-proteobacteria)]MDO4658708.1 hypothetical protein [Kingella sp. (in: b-proteobacteria)]
MAWLAVDVSCFQAAFASGVGNELPSLRFISEPVFTISIGRFYEIKARIQGKKRSKVGHLASIFNAVATFLGHKICLWKW